MSRVEQAQLLSKSLDSLILDPLDISGMLTSNAFPIMSSIMVTSQIKKLLPKPVLQLSACSISFFRVTSSGVQAQCYDLIF